MESAGSDGCCHRKKRENSAGSDGCCHRKKEDHSAGSDGCCHTKKGITLQAVTDAVTKKEGKLCRQ
jgi:hypothetical protein